VLIVGGVAALTAIAVYLAWHFLRQWRLAAGQRDASRRAVGERSPGERTRAARELVPWE
jgi:hypothetical protein